MTIAAATSPDTTSADVAELCDVVAAHPRLLVLTGAGCSTDSGIPDYRDVDGQWKRQQPMRYQPFVTDPAMRARYWARSLIGWRHFGHAEPNEAHRALASLEAAGRVDLLVTQNVDGLHQTAGSQRVVDLHGRIDWVVCLGCRRTTPRDSWQARLSELNTEWAGLDAPIAPDGDADLDGLDFRSFVVPECDGCGGTVKPDVVFFGENVPADRHLRATAALEAADALLIVGSSLMVFSGYRYAVKAAKLAKPVIAVNLGRTRADHLLTFKLEAPVGPTLTRLASAFNVP